VAYEKNKSETYTNVGGLNQKTSVYLTDQNEVLQLKNMHFLTLGAVTKRPGITLYTGASVAGRIGGLYEFEKLSGASYIVATANTNAYLVTNSFNSFRSNLLNDGLFDFVTFTDRMFAGNGQDFFKFDGVNSSNYSLPPGGLSYAAFGITATGGGGLSGTVIAAMGYLNDRGYAGPTSPGVTLALNGISYNAILYYGMSFPAGYGITSFAFYRSGAGQVDLFGTTFSPVTAGSTFVDFSPLSTRPMPESLWFTLAPKYLEIFNNQLVMAGFSSMLSTVYWSDIGEPESVLPEYFAEVRTNDGDVVRGLKSYSNDLIINKQKSFHRLSGTNPNNFTLQQISDQYGTLSNRSMVVYNNLLLFLDSKGIIKYNGANIEVLSNRVESTINRINVPAAIENATAIHFRKYNEVWFSFPVDDSLVNNHTLVYDYLADAWAEYDGFDVSSLMVGQGRLPSPTAMVGTYGGQVSYFEDEIYSDYGQPIECLFQTRFTTLMGQSIEQQFRRFYLNVDPITGITQPIGIDLRSNFGDTRIVGHTIYQAPFQTRIDFGVPAKTLSAVVNHVSASLSFKVFGWTIESRYQRST